MLKENFMFFLKKRVRPFIGFDKKIRVAIFEFDIRLSK